MVSSHFLFFQTFTCLDGHFNNLNCLAFVAAEILPSVAKATMDEMDEAEGIEIRAVKDFLSLLSSQTLHHVNQVWSNTKDDKQDLSERREVTDSILLLLALIAEKSESLLGPCAFDLPLPFPLLHRARNAMGTSGDRKRSAKRFKALRMEEKALTSQQEFTVPIIMR